MKPTSILTIALVLLAAAAARAQDTTLGDARWAPWLGCWHLVQDDRGSIAAAVTTPDDVVVCVLPASENRGVSMTTYVGGQSVLQQTVVADGARHPVSEPACNGSQASEWSRSGQQLLTRADITCIGQPARTVSAITLMAAGPTWVDIQAVGTGQDAQVRVRRYRRTDSLPQSVVLPTDLQGRLGAAAARLADPAVMTLEEVVEASGKVAAPAVAAALYETGSRFNLNGRTLKALAAAHVPDGVVDVMVALSFPGHVAIDRPFRGSTGQTRGATTASVHPVDETPLVLLLAYYPPYYPPSVYDPYYAYRPYPPYSFSYWPFGYSSWWGDPYRPYYSTGRRPSLFALEGQRDQVAATGTGATSCRGVATHGGDLRPRTLRARAVRPRPTTRHDRRAARSREAATRAAGHVRAEDRVLAADRVAAGAHVRAGPALARDERRSHDSRPLDRCGCTRAPRRVPTADAYFADLLRGTITSTHRLRTVAAYGYGLWRSTLPA